MKEIKLHPSYWVLHKKYWQEEYDNLDKFSASEVMSNPTGYPARNLEKKVIFKIRQNLRGLAKSIN
jgi:hypothetical protein